MIAARGRQSTSGSKMAPTMPPANRTTTSDQVPLATLGGGSGNPWLPQEGSEEVEHDLQGTERDRPRQDQPKGRTRPGPSVDASTTNRSERASSTWRSPPSAVPAASTTWSERASSNRISDGSSDIVGRRCICDRPTTSCAIDEVFEAFFTAEVTTDRRPCQPRVWDTMPTCGDGSPKPARQGWQCPRAVGGADASAGEWRRSRHGHLGRTLAPLPLVEHIAATQCDRTASNRTTADVVRTSWTERDQIATVGFDHDLVPGRRGRRRGGAPNRRRT